MKNQKSYFIILPENPEVFFASWKIDPEETPKKILKSLKNSAGLLLEVYSISGNEKTKIDSMPVHGLENNWHIFTKKQYRGKRLVFTLCHGSPGGGITGLITSKEIDVPLSEIQIAELKKSTAKYLFSMSQINLAEYSGPGKNSSW